jgi:RNA polymerase sigma factor (sigma-70 family)
MEIRVCHDRSIIMIASTKPNTTPNSNHTAGTVAACQQADISDGFEKILLSVMQSEVKGTQTAQPAERDIVFLRAYRTSLAAMRSFPKLEPHDYATAAILSWVQHWPSLLMRWDSSRSLSRWAFSSLRRITVDCARRTRQWATLPFAHEVPADDQDNPSRRAEANELSDKIDKCIAQLPARDRSVLTMSFYNGMNIHEIAEALGKSRLTISRWKFRAMAKLRTRIARDYPNLARDL